jgi:CHAT domain-containing protein
VHLACHGEFSWLDPTASGLQLAGNELLSARDVASLLRLEEVRLVVLSACETGITESDRLPNEYVGLAGSFLQAGAPTVVCSLWSVEDESTARLMGAFYERHVAGGAPPAAALRDAQLRLRADGDFAHPFYWAPFLVMGA